MCWSLFFNKVAGLRSNFEGHVNRILLKKKLQHKRFPVKFVTFSEQFFYFENPNDCF